MQSRVRHLLLLPLAALIPGIAAAQSLRGSPGSVDRMYYRARAQHLTFYETAEAVEKAVPAGEVALLRGNMDYAVVGTRVPYVRPATLRFVERLGAAHRAACGEPIIVTSGIRPTERRLRNSHAKSVHPTGMAVDIRKSPGRCRDWLRNALVGLEAQGVIEATEEFHPPHFHIAVFDVPASAAIVAAANHVAPAKKPARRAAARRRGGG